MFVVAGATGNTGSVVARALLDAKQPVRVVVRDAAKGARWKERGAEVAVSDLFDGGSLAEALRGASGAYLLVPPAAPSATQVFERSARIVEAQVAALLSAGVRNVVFLSSVGADLPGGTGIVKTLYEAEQRYPPGLPATFLRAAYFMENWGGSLQGVQDQGELATFFTPASRKFPMVATADVGEAAAKLLLEPAGVRRAIDVVGPVEYSPDDVANALTHVLGRPVRTAVYPVAAMVPALTGFGFSPETAALYQQLTEGLNAGKVAPGRGERLIRGTRTLEATLARMLGRA